MSKKKTVKTKKQKQMKKIFEVTEKEMDIEELKRKIMDWPKKQIHAPNNIRRRPCGGCDVIL